MNSKTRKAAENKNKQETRLYYILLLLLIIYSLFLFYVYVDDGVNWEITEIFKIDVDFVISVIS